MRLQLALDELTLDEAVGIVSELRDLIDIVEIGTPLVIKEGLAAVAAVRKRFPETTILADLKIMDGGSYESRIAFEAGADIVSVLALAHEVTIQAAVEQAGAHDGEIMIDLMGTDDTAAGVERTEGLRADWVCVHTAADLTGKQAMDSRSLGEAVATARRCRVAVAGGINLDTVAQLARYRPATLVVGSAIVKSRDRRQTALRLREVALQADRNTE